MRSTLSRTAHADQLEADLRGARCCDASEPCADCAASIAEARAARRDAVIHSLTRARPRRHSTCGRRTATGSMTRW